MSNGCLLGKRPLTRSLWNGGGFTSQTGEVRPPKTEVLFSYCFHKGLQMTFNKLHSTALILVPPRSGTCLFP